MQLSGFRSCVSDFISFNKGFSIFQHLIVWQSAEKSAEVYNVYLCAACLLTLEVMLPSPRRSMFDIGLFRLRAKFNLGRLLVSLFHSCLLPPVHQVSALGRLPPHCRRFVAASWSLFGFFLVGLLPPVHQVQECCLSCCRLCNNLLSFIVKGSRVSFSYIEKGFFEFPSTLTKRVVVSKAQ